jgi:predicted Fe-Mo cluster-binding NifX family protein
LAERLGRALADVRRRLDEVETAEARGGKQRMKIALPVFEGRVSSVFDWAERLLVVESDGSASTRREVDIEGLLPAPRARRLRELGVEKLLCGAISAPLVALVEEQGVEVVAGLVGEVDAVVGAFARDALGDPEFMMPGWRCAGRRRCRGRRVGRGRRSGAGRGRNSNR